MSGDGSLADRCGIDTVELDRFGQFLANTPPDDLSRLFTPVELQDAGEDPGRVAGLAARFAAKEACCKLFPRETALGRVQPSDFSVRRDGYGAPVVEPGPNARAILDLHRLAGISLSLTHTARSASAMALGVPARLDVPWFGRLLFGLVPIRRRTVMTNLRRVFGGTLPEPEIRRLAQAHYAHFARLLAEFVVLPCLPRKRRQAMVRVENMEAPIRAHTQDKGLLILTGHFGNWEVATVAGIAQFPQYKHLFHFLRRPLKPPWFDALVTSRFRRAGFGTLSSRGSADAILDLLGRGGIVVFPFDQHAAGKDGVAVDFLGEPAGTHKSMAILAMTTGTPVLPASSWREPDGTHVLRFEDPVPWIECEDVNEAIRRNTRAYNAALERLVLRHPEQWFWMHRRWKLKRPPPTRRA
jgi:KDO2-lipid IV(A) lauroyltransferase